MKTTEPQESLLFDYHTIRLIIGLIALLLPWIVIVRARMVTPSISWSYHTNARDLFVGLLFIIGAFLVSYKGHKISLAPEEAGKFAHWLSKFWKGAIRFRLWERKNEEDWVSTVGGFAAIFTALFPTAYCTNNGCPNDPVSNAHLTGAFILFSTIVYFCLVAFMNQVKEKMKDDQGRSTKGGTSPKQLRAIFYSICGWGIVVILLSMIFVSKIHVIEIQNLTFWTETAALELFGVAWMIASQFLPIFTEQDERRRSL